MRHFMQYHKSEAQGQLPESVDEFYIFATKSIRHLEGHRVWLITGEGIKSPKRYFLRYFFDVDRIEIGKPNRAFGTVGQDFLGSKRLDALGWFPGFMKRYQNFSLGVRPLIDDDVKLFQSVAGV